jgi:hypothetical protein
VRPSGSPSAPRLIGPSPPTEGGRRRPRASGDGSIEGVAVGRDWVSAGAHIVRRSERGSADDRVTRLTYVGIVVGVSRSSADASSSPKRKRYDSKTHMLEWKTEREGFEPSIPLDAVYRISRKRTEPD